MRSYFSGELTWSGTGDQTVYDPNSPLIKRLALHHDHKPSGHGMNVLFSSTNDARAAEVDIPLGIVAASNPIKVYYEKFPLTTKGHIIVTGHRHVLSGQMKG